MPLLHGISPRSLRRDLRRIPHSLPETEEFRDLCMILRGGSASNLMADMTGHGKRHSLPEAEEPREQPPMRPVREGHRDPSVIHEFDGGITARRKYSVHNEEGSKSSGQ